MSHPIHPSHEPSIKKSSPTKPDTSAYESSQGTHKYLGMTFTEEEWKKFVENECKMVQQEIQRAEDKAKEAAQAFRESLEED